MNNMNDEIEIKPNAFAFKALIGDQYKMCICPRISGSWSEQDIFYVENPIKEVYDSLDDNLFNVIFVVYEKDEAGFWIKPPTKSYFLKSDTAVAKDMYLIGNFFSMVEKGYQHFYEQKSEQTSGEGEQTQTSEEK